MIFHSRFRPVLATLIAIWLLASTGPVQAGEADIVGVSIHQSAPGIYRFDVSVSHADSGWEHYANSYEILDAEGNVLATRVLMHPHVNEQPFTRSLSGVQISPDLTVLRVRATDSVHGTGGQEYILEKNGESWNAMVFVQAQ